MTNEIAKVDGKAVMAGSMEWTREQVELIKITVARNTSDSQLKLFLYTCKKTGLDPLAKQIHCIVRQTNKGPVMSIQTAIDGYRLVADRSGKYAGNDDPIYDNEDTPRKASVTVYKMVGSQRCGFTATARWSQYFPGEAQGFMWKKMPHLMLGKCAEALALRKAFPAELSGLYTHDEMAQAQVEIVAEPPKPQPPPQRKSAQEPTTEELKALADKKAADYHKEPEEGPKAPPTAPKEVPEGFKLATGAITYATDANKGGYRSFAIEGQQKEDGKDMMFATKDTAIIDEMLGYIQTGEQVSVQYTETHSGRWINFNIQSVSKV